jgi:hypothetical protein
MTRPSRAVRSASLFFALLQLTLPGTVAWADARLEQQTLQRAGLAHVESHSTPSCGRGHLADCALCRFVSAVFGAGRRVIAVGVQPATRRVPVPQGRILRTLAVRDRLPDSRAPPVLS